MMQPKERDLLKREIAETRRIVERLKELFGPPPLIDGENPEDFDRILFGVVRARCPADFLLQMHAWDSASEIWNGLRLERYSRRIVENTVRRNQKLQEKRSQLVEQKQSRQEAGISHHANIESDSGLTDNEKRMSKLEDVVENVVPAVDEILNRAVLEEENARAFQQVIDSMVKIDDLKSKSFSRRNYSIEMLMTYRRVTAQLYTMLEDERYRRLREEDKEAWLVEMSNHAEEKQKLEEPQQQESAAGDENVRGET
jgi:hypothetical protein